MSPPGASTSRGASQDAGEHENGASADYVDSYEDVSIFRLSEERERRLLDAQTECTFMWTNRAGEPVGVIMNFVVRDGRFWITCTRQRKRVPAVVARPRVALAITSRGTDIGISQTVTYKGTATVRDDDATKTWFYPAPGGAGASRRRCSPGGVLCAPRHRRSGDHRDRTGHAHRIRLRADVQELPRRAHDVSGQRLSRQAKPWPERPVSAANESGNQRLQQRKHSRFREAQRHPGQLADHSAQAFKNCPERSCGPP